MTHPITIRIPQPQNGTSSPPELTSQLLDLNQLRVALTIDSLKLWTHLNGLKAEKRMPDDLYAKVCAAHKKIAGANDAEKEKAQEELLKLTPLVENHTQFVADRIKVDKIKMRVLGEKLKEVDKDLESVSEDMSDVEAQLRTKFGDEFAFIFMTVCNNTLHSAVYAQRLKNESNQ